MDEKSAGRTSVKNKGVFIICEGQTEEEFVKKCLTPYLRKQGVRFVRAIIMETSPGNKGGDVRFGRLKFHVYELLNQQEDLLVTTLIDFYRLRRDFPKYEESLFIVDKMKRVAFLEKAMAEDIHEKRFIPYIQLHEFEGLLFSSKNGFNILPRISDKTKQAISDIVADYPNPELINDGIYTAPSKRLKKLIPHYHKVLYGSMIAHEIGIETIMRKCERFHAWIDGIVHKAVNPEQIFI